MIKPMFAGCSSVKKIMFTSVKIKYSKTALGRALFVLGLCYVVWFFLVSGHPLKVETDLKDISPALSSDPALSKTIDAVGDFGSKRIVILLRADDREQLHNAKRNFSKRLAKYTNVQVISDDFMQRSVVAALTPYRFNLLTSQQREQLLHKTIAEIIETEHRKLYRLGSDYGLIPFEQDPLAWFSEYLLDSQSGLKSQASGSQAPGVNSAESYTDAITVSIIGPLRGMDAQQQLLNKILQTENSVKQEHSVEVYKSGVIFFSVDAATKSKADILLIAVTSSIAIVVLMVLVFRSLTPLLVAIASIGMGVLFAVSVTLNVFHNIHILTIVFGSSLIGIVIDYSLHYFFHRLSQGAQTSFANKSLSNAMLLSLMTSFIGFGALMLSDVGALKRVAVFSCAGLVMAWLTVMTLGPFVDNTRALNQSSVLKKLTVFLGAVFSHRPILLLRGAGSVALLGLFYLLIFGVDGSDDPRLFFNQSERLLAQERMVSEHSVYYESNQFFVVGGNSVSDLNKTLEALYQIAGNHQTGLLSVKDWLPPPDEQIQSYQLQGKLYGENGVVAGLLRKLNVPDTAVEPVMRDYLAGSGKALLPKDLNRLLPWLPPMWSEYRDRHYANVLIEKGGDSSALKRWSQGNDNVHFVNVASYAETALRHQRNSATALLCGAYIAIAIIMLLYYRTASSLAYLAIPASATVFTLIALPLLGQPITLFHMMALFLVLGLGMDYIVFAKEMTNHDLITQQAILLSAMTSLLSFGLLSFSSMPVVQAFGSTVLIGNTINLIATFTFFNVYKAGRN